MHNAVVNADSVGRVVDNDTFATLIGRATATASSRGNDITFFRLGNGDVLASNELALVKFGSTGAAQDTARNGRRT